jgi:phosphoglycolate phosphatase
MMTVAHSKLKADLLMFDLDGTLVDSTADLTQSANYVRRQYGLAPLSIPDLRGFVGDGAWALIEKSMPELSAEQRQQALHLFRSHYSLHSTDFTVPYPGCRQVLQHFRQKKLAVVTNKPDLMSRQVLDAFGLSPYIGLLVGGDTARKKKPAAEHILQVLEWSGCPADQALMVGDGCNDVEAATAAGVLCCGVRYGIGNPVGRNGERPAFLIDSLLELLQTVE